MVKDLKSEDKKLVLDAVMKGEPVEGCKELMGVGEEGRLMASVSERGLW